MEFPEGHESNSLSVLQRTIHVDVNSDDFYVHHETLYSKDVIELIDLKAKFLDTSMGSPDLEHDLWFVSYNDVVEYYQKKPGSDNLLFDLYALKDKINNNKELQDHRRKKKAFQLENVVTS